MQEIITYRRVLLETAIRFKNIFGRQWTIHDNE